MDGLSLEKEKELLLRSKNGEEEAFNVLVTLFRPHIFHLCCSIVKDQEIAEDLTQETFVKAYRHLDQFEMRARFSTWIHRIATNLSINYLRKKARAKESAFNEAVLIETEEKSEAESIPKIDEDFQESIKEGLHALPQKQRLVFEMYDLEHIPQKEIAALLHINEGTVRSRLHYARKRMRAYLEKSKEI